MDLKLLKAKMEEYFSHSKLEFHTEEINNDGLHYIATEMIFTINALDNLEVQLVALGYENGTSQVNFNFGECDTLTLEFIRDCYDFNQNNFGFKATREYDELRFYNQAFFASPEEFIFNLDHQISGFLNDKNLENCKRFIKYIH